MYDLHIKIPEIPPYTHQRCVHTYGQIKTYQFVRTSLCDVKGVSQLMFLLGARQGALKVTGYGAKRSDRIDNDI